MRSEVLSETSSVCPVCLRRVPARRVASGDQVFLEKACPEHGPFRTVLWRGHQVLADWVSPAQPAHEPNPDCPRACGLCASHLQGTCCVLLEVTERCDLRCRFCFAQGGGSAEPSFETLEADLLRLAKPGQTLVQLSGGEPAMRDDLPRIVAAARKAGCKYVQLNTTGLRLARDRSFAEALAEAGLSFVFMQFDGTRDAVHRELRGRPLQELKEQAIENCGALGLGVTLVPTLVPGVNTDDIGAILRFAVARSPAVRGVHFQPVSYLGRVPARPTDEMRFTLDQLVRELERQSRGLVKAEDLAPSGCDHPLCGFHGDFIVTPDQGLMALSKRERVKPSCCCPDAADKNREFVARRWRRQPAAETTCCGDLRDMEQFAGRARSHGFTVTAMAFQDAGSLDLERLRHCSLHVFDGGRLVPFCAYYLSAWKPS